MSAKSVRKSAATASTKVTDVNCPSGIEGLDDILAGGLPSQGFCLIQGDPGSGKTTMELQFLLEGLRRGEKALYITLSETKQELLKVARLQCWTYDNITYLYITY